MRQIRATTVLQGGKMTTNAPAVAALSLAGVWGASVFGISVSTVVVATGFTILGAFGRLGFEISNASNQSGGAKWSSIAALFGGSMTSAATITVLYLALLKMIGIQSDGVSVIGLLFFGFVGPKALLWLFQTASTQITKRTGIILPQFGAPPAKGGGSP